MLKQSHRLVPLAVLILFGAGCGGSSSSSAPSRGGVSFAVSWPPSMRFLGANATLVVVDITGPGGYSKSLTFTKPVNTDTQNPPTPTPQTAPDLTPGTYTIVASSYHSIATERPLATKTLSVPVVAGPNQDVPIVLDPTLLRIVAQITDPNLVSPSTTTTYFYNATDTQNVVSVTKYATPISPLTEILAARLKITAESAAGGLILFAAPTGLEVSSETASKFTVAVDTPRGGFDSSRDSQFYTITPVTAGGTASNLVIKYKDIAGNNAEGPTTTTYNLPIRIVSP